MPAPVSPNKNLKYKFDPTYYLGYYPEKYWNWDACMEIMGLFDNPKSFFFGNNDGEFRWNILKEHLGSIREVLLMPGMYPRLQGLGQNYYEIDNMEYPTDDSAQSKYKKAEWTAITNCVQLQAMANNSSGKYYLDRDIDCTYCTQNPGGALYNGGLGFNPVNLNDGGEFVSDGFSITGLKINRPLEDNVGLFGEIWENLSGITLKDFIITGRDNVGALVGRSHLVVSNCFSSGTVNGSSRVGGLIGYGGARSCSSSCIVSGWHYIGGLIGCGVASDSYATGVVSATAVGGGLIGVNTGTTSNSYATGNVNKGGGLVGDNVTYGNGIIDNCYATGNVGIGGGLVGRNRNWNWIKNSHSTGIVTDGGLLVRTCENAYIHNSYSGAYHSSAGCPYGWGTLVWWCANCNCS